MTAPALEQKVWVEQIMGLPISIHVRGHDPCGQAVQDRVAAVFAQLRRADEVLSPYRDTPAAPTARSLPAKALTRRLTTTISSCSGATSGWIALGIPAYGDPASRPKTPRPCHQPMT